MEQAPTINKNTEEKWALNEKEQRAKELGEEIRKSAEALLYYNPVSNGFTDVYEDTGEASFLGPHRPDVDTVARENVRFNTERATSLRVVLKRISEYLDEIEKLSPELRKC